MGLLVAFVGGMFYYSISNFRTYLFLSRLQHKAHHHWPQEHAIPIL